MAGRSTIVSAIRTRKSNSRRSWWLILSGGGVRRIFWVRSPDTLTTQFSFHLRDMKLEEPSFVIHEFMADPFAGISERSDALLKRAGWASTSAGNNIAINLPRSATQRGTEIERIWSIIRFVYCFGRSTENKFLTRTRKLSQNEIKSCLNFNRHRKPLAHEICSETEFILSSPLCIEESLDVGSVPKLLTLQKERDTI